MIDKRKWVQAVNAATLPQSAKRYAAWLVTRPVKGRDDEYKAGQTAAASALGFSLKTAHNAETTLVNNRWMRRSRRGTRRSNYSTFVILDAAANLQKLQVVADLQHELGGRLYVVPQPAKSSASMTTAPLRTNRNRRSTADGQSASRLNRLQTQRRIDERAAANFLVDATSRNALRTLRTVSV